MILVGIMLVLTLSILIANFLASSYKEEIKELKEEIIKLKVRK